MSNSFQGKGKMSVNLHIHYADGSEEYAPVAAQAICNNLWEPVADEHKLYWVKAICIGGIWLVPTVIEYPPGYFEWPDVFCAEVGIDYIPQIIQDLQTLIAELQKKFPDQNIENFRINRLNIVLDKIGAMQNNPALFKELFVG